MISAADWQRCADPGLIDAHREVALAVDTSPDRSTTSIVAAGWTAGGLPYVDLLESRRGDPSWALPKLTELWARHSCRALVIDSISAASTLIDPLRRAGVTVTTTNAPKMAQAWGQLFDRVITGQLRHLGQPALAVAVAVAAGRKRKIGDGWGWNRATSGDT